MVAASAKTSPASGWTVVASVVTRAGPTMKTTSSTTDSNAKAVRRSPLSSTRCDQRDRTDEPIWGSAGTGHGGEQVRPRRGASRLDRGHHPDQPEGEESRRPPAAPGSVRTGR